MSWFGRWSAFVGYLPSAGIRLRESEWEPSAAVERAARDGQRLGVGPRAHEEKWGPASSEERCPISAISTRK